MILSVPPNTAGSGEPIAGRPHDIPSCMSSAGHAAIGLTQRHQGGAGVNGPMAIELNPGFTGDTLDGSVPVNTDLAARILANPSQFYVKLHSLKFPGGAIRGQLRSCP